MSKKRSKEETQISDNLESAQTLAAQAADQINATPIEAMTSRQLRDVQRECVLAARDANLAATFLYVFIRLAESDGR